MLHESLLDQQLFGIDVGDAIADMGASGADHCVFSTSRNKPISFNSYDLKCEAADQSSGDGSERLEGLREGIGNALSFSFRIFI